ncbi:hemin ABC transporter substrate-binding protein [Rhodobacteraceae bacterium RKSG542]|uniref:heme/hemin ABC transporter substrate-binding protein n=1 Tax=Pseudovibrio flavus TaxID=2529854 RepID=UPI0012BBAF81|nr:hemin ABC transporter substrate-binding protein [Pseudovibrio flavus]MTI17118.1 hemin ABC transporter substrate-binding protein [Pseudovibrio flavus]
MINYVKSALRLSLSSLFLSVFAMPHLAAAEDTAPQRITSVGSSITEIIYALGEEDRLVAVDTTSLYPPEAQKLPNVGYMRALSAEGLLSVEPDLVLMVEGSGPENTLDVLKASSVPIIPIPEEHSLDGVKAKIEKVAAALSVEDKGKKLIAAFDKDAEALAKITAAMPAKPSVMFVLSVGSDRLMVSGLNTGANAAIELAGGRNAMDTYDGYKQVTVEAVVEAQPDIILLSKRLQTDKPEEKLAAIPGIELTPAGQNEAFVTMDAVYLLGFGPRAASAIKDLSVKLSELAS